MADSSVWARRILMTADTVGGVWQYSLDLATALGSRGFHVTLAVMGPAMRADQRIVAAERGITVVEGPFDLEWMPEGQAHFAAAGEWLLALADRNRADLVHLNGFTHAALPWRVPVLVVAHSCVRTWWRAVHGNDAPPSWDLYSDRVAAGLRAASMVIAPSAAMLSDLHREYGAFAPSAVIPNGSSAVDAPAPAAGTKQRLVFSAGRLWDEAKNVAAVCDVAPRLSWPVCIAGEATGPSAALAASGAVRYLGRLPSAQMRRWYDRAAIYALPARYEPFGLSVLEAAARGCALVLGDIASLRENWSEAAIFVPPDNRAAMTGAIEGLIRDGAMRDELGSRAVKRAARFTIANMTRAYLSAYSRLLVPVAAA